MNMTEKKLPFNKTQIEEIIKQYPTPFHIYDEAGIKSAVGRLQDAFSWNKGFKQYFAVKALPNPAILKLLKSMDCGTDCASLTELMLSEYCGIKGESIVFSSNETPSEDYKLAVKLGAIINLDDITQIDFLEKHAGIPEKICLRYNPGGDFSITSDIMGHLTDSKFGMTKSQLFEAIALLKNKGAKSFGVHAMLKSCDLTSDYYPQLAKTLFELAVEIRDTLSVSLDFVDFGGGVGIPYRPEENEIDIKNIGEQIHGIYDEIITANGMNLSIFTELGRYITGPYGFLVTTVIHRKNIYKNYLGLDATACNLMRPAIYGAYHHITIMGKENEALTEKYDVVGSLCENNDKFAIDRSLPKADIGDILVIHDTGAHGFSMGYNYNGRLRSAEVLLKEDGKAELIRKAETPNDYFSTLIPLYPELQSNN